MSWLARAFLLSVCVACVSPAIALAHGPLPPGVSTPVEASRPQLAVARVPVPPRIADFVPPRAEARSGLVEVAGFVQQSPIDGAPASQETRAYVGYDADNLYVVWVCSDSNPGLVRAHVSRRENILDDDYVQVNLDTFADQRHGTVFAANAHGVQADGLWTEDAGAIDYSWDGVWRSQGVLTARGYVVRMEIPFRTLRFGTTSRTWGITFLRVIGRSGERAYWPRVSSRVAGELNQAAALNGLDAVKAGRNLQFDPHLAARNYRALDTRDAANPRFTSKTVEAEPGLDAKAVLRGNLVVDATVNPDFSQVESDEPQNAANQRFEVYYPEKRPFFLENSNYFASAQGQYELTPLVFTRRILDPRVGLKLSGKLGPWTLGALAADDRSPGKQVAPGDPLSGRGAVFYAAQVSHDIGRQSSVGAIFTAREFAGTFNRVGGVLATIRLGENWTSRVRSVVSLTEERTGSAAESSFHRSGGYDHEAVLAGSGRRFQSTTLYQDVSAGFRTDTGFLQRSDIRRVSQYGHFYFRPPTGALLSWGPEMSAELVRDHAGVLLRYSCSIDPVFAFRRNTYVAPIVGVSRDTLRPQDFAGLARRASFSGNEAGFVFGTSPISQLSWRTLFIRSGTVNVVPPAGQPPSQGDATTLVQTLVVRPGARLQIDNSYILARVLDRETGRAIFNNHIARTKWNYQLTREMSLRFIAQYNGLLANPGETVLTTQKSVNLDILATYLLHPGTALYVGYNTDMANLLPGLCPRLPDDSFCVPGTNGPTRTTAGMMNDGRQFFFKISYLFQR